MSREKNIEIFKDTLQYCLINEKLNDSIKNSIKNQKVISNQTNNKTSKYDQKAEIIISKKRSFQAASNYKDNKVGVLNFASYTSPGGGVFKGSHAQEEALCRCSTLYPCLKEVEDKFHKKHIKQLLNHEINILYGDDCILTPEVVVFRKDNESADLLDESEWYCVDIITSAAPNLRKKPSNNMNPSAGIETVLISDEELYKLHIKRITQIFKIAKNAGVEVLIVGAFGCGAFRNPPEIVARAFNEVIGNFIKDFKIIEFAIYSSSKENINYRIFKKVFKSDNQNNW